MRVKEQRQNLRVKVGFGPLEGHQRPLKLQKKENQMAENECRETQGVKKPPRKGKWPYFGISSF